MTTYQPTGTGICKVCGRDVGRHDAGHSYNEWQSPERGSHCMECEADRDHPIHDVGRVLRCPKEER